MLKLVRSKIKYVLFIPLIALSANLHATEPLSNIRVGVLNFGTVNWELETIKRQKLDMANQISIDIVPLGSKNATHVALQGDAVDIIVTDWIWVSRQRHLGRDYTFVPYSTATGSLMVNNDSDIETLADLKGKRIGVAGGPLDKSWLLLSAYTKKTTNQKLDAIVEPKFAAPPLLNELFIRGQFESVLNFWHYTARLQSLGSKTLLKINEILPALGIKRPLPMIGWVFSESWANANSQLVQLFIKTSSQAKQILLENDQAWIDIKDMIKPDSDEMASMLRDAYRLGIPSCFNQEDLASMSKAYNVLAQYGGKELVGKSTRLMPGTVWQNIMVESCN